MSFEEKYSRFRNSKNRDVSDDYVNEMAGKVSERIAGKKPFAGGFSVWSYAAATAMAMMVGLVIYFQIGDAPKTTVDNNITHDTENIAKLPLSHKKDSGTFASTPTKQDIQKIDTKDIDQEVIIEYLLDEGYEEI